MRRKKERIGAPMGGRVHWLLLFLSKRFLNAYRLRFDYEYHNYYFSRYDGRTVRDEFIVVRTSRSCFRVMYFNHVNTYFEYFSEPTAKRTAEHMEELFEKVMKAESYEKRDC